MSRITVSIFNSHLLFEEIISDEDLLCLSSGYEEQAFRYSAIVELIFEALPDFALTENEKTSLSVTNITRKMKKAAKLVYASEKYSRRGEFGEILLHIVLRDFYNTIPAISKLYYKDGANETVKGFDAVHIVPTDKGLELWLGEVKFYNDINKAIRDVIPEIYAHSKRDYLRSEFMFISNKIDDSWPYSDQLKDLIDDKVSLDSILKRIRIPVLLTYDSTTVKSHKEISDSFVTSLTQEFNQASQKFRSQVIPDIEVFLILIPLEEKKKLVTYLDERLRTWQNI